MKNLMGWSLIGAIVSIIPYCLTSIAPSVLTTANHDPYLASLEFDFTDLNEVDYKRSAYTITPGDIQTIIDLTQLGIGLVGTIRGLFDKNFNGSTFNHIDFEGVGEEKLLSMFRTVSHRLNEIQAGVSGTQIGLRQLANNLPDLVRWEIALASISEYALPINSLYHKFNFYQIHRTEVEDHTLSDFATSVVTHDTSSIQALMANIHAMVAPADPPMLEQIVASTYFDREEYTVTAERRVNTEYIKKLRQTLRQKKGRDKEFVSKIGNIYFRPSIFTILSDALEGTDVCNMDQSPQSMVYGFYTLLALTQARGYAMMNFAWLLLRYYKEGDFIAEQQLSDELYMHYSKGIQREAVKALSIASNMYRKCDPKVHEEGKTYEMIKELLQGYIENEVDLNAQGTCSDQCSSYKHSKVEGCYMPETQYCGKHRRCKGKVHECNFMYADAYVCISEEKYKRYDWVRYSNSEVLGKESHCKDLMEVHSWWRFLYHCSYCTCYCDDPSSTTTERYISLLAAVSDIGSNKIVTGARFIKKNKVIHIQIQEATVKPQGQVDVKSQKWADVEPISIDRSKYVAGEDYIVLKYETRHVDLDTLIAPRGHVVTGLRFVMLGDHLNLQMWITPINFTNGIMSRDDNYWMNNQNTPNMPNDPRTEIILTDPVNPTSSVIENEVRSINNSYIKLSPTTFYSDVAQMTVPFFDAQEVVPNPAVWLQGVGLYFRGTGNSGGFFGLSVHSYNLTSHFHQDVF